MMNLSGTLSYDKHLITTFFDVYLFLLETETEHKACNNIFKFSSNGF